MINNKFKNSLKKIEKEEDAMQIVTDYEEEYALTGQNVGISIEESNRLNLKEIDGLMEEGKFISAFKAMEFAHRLPSVELDLRKIIILTHYKKFEYALNLSNKKIYRDNIKIQSQKIDLLYKMGKSREAIEICDNDIFRKDITIQAQKAAIESSYLSKNDEFSDEILDRSKMEQIYMLAVYYKSLERETDFYEKIKGFYKFKLNSNEDIATKKIITEISFKKKKVLDTNKFRNIIECTKEFDR